MYIYIYIYTHINNTNQRNYKQWIPFGDRPLKIRTMQRRLAWPLRKDDTHTSRCVNRLQIIYNNKLIKQTVGRAKQIIIDINIPNQRSCE